MKMEKRIDKIEGIKETVEFKKLYNECKKKSTTIKEVI